MITPVSVSTDEVYTVLAPKVAVAVMVLPLQANVQLVNLSGHSLVANVEASELLSRYVA